MHLLLGVLIDGQLSFKPHINVIVAKAHLRAGQILRCFRAVILKRWPELLLRTFIHYWNIVLQFGLSIQWA